MSLIEKSGYNDGLYDICQILVLNKIDTILDTISLGDEGLKAVYKSTPCTKPSKHLSKPQHNSIKFLQYYNTHKYRVHGSFPFKQWLIVTREEFETFHISCNPFYYISQPTLIPPTNIFPAHDPIKDVMYGVKKDASIFPKLNHEKQ